MTTALTRQLVVKMQTTESEAALAQLLEALSPDDVVRSEILLLSFISFLSRCSVEQQRMLLPHQNNFRPRLPYVTMPTCLSSHSIVHTRSNWQAVESSQATPSPPPLAAGVAFPSHSDLRPVQDLQLRLEAVVSATVPQNELSSNSSASASELSIGCILAQNDEYTKAHAAFVARLGPRRNHAKHLVKALRGFLGAIDINIREYDGFWSSRTRIFVGSGTNIFTRFRRLYDGFMRVKARREVYDCASRLCYVFLDHDLEILLKDGSLPTSRGRGKKTAAFRAQAESISSTVESIRADSKSGRCYLQLLRCSSPGYLLLTGNHTNTLWERKLSKTDIPILLEYIYANHPEVTQKAALLDTIAAKLILDGFLAYGWTESELNNTRTRLLDQLRLYISFSSTGEDTIVNICDIPAVTESILSGPSAINGSDASTVMRSMTANSSDAAMEYDDCRTPELPGMAPDKPSIESSGFAAGIGEEAPDFTLIPGTDQYFELLFRIEQSLQYPPKEHEWMCQQMIPQEDITID